LASFLGSAFFSGAFSNFLGFSSSEEEADEELDDLELSFLASFFGVAFVGLVSSSEEDEFSSDELDIFNKRE